MPYGLPIHVHVHVVTHSVVGEGAEDTDGTGILESFPELVTGASSLSMTMAYLRSLIYLFSFLSFDIRIFPTHSTVPFTAASLSTHLTFLCLFTWVVISRVGSL
jgi:hypothetical protein